MELRLPNIPVRVLTYLLYDFASFTFNLVSMLFFDIIINVSVVSQINTKVERHCINILCDCVNKLISFTNIPT